MNTTIRDIKEKFYSALMQYIDSRLKHSNLDSLTNTQEALILDKYYELLKLINDTLKCNTIEG